MLPSADRTGEEYWGADLLPGTPNAHVASAEEKGVAHAAPGANQTIIIVERKAFLRDCLRRSVTYRSHSHAIGCATLGELTKIPSDGRSQMILLSTLSLSDVEKDEEFERLANLDPQPLTMVLAKSDDLDSVLLALRLGANGYISTNSRFEIFIQALQFVGAGGTYFPPQCLVQAKKKPAGTAGALARLITNREMSVIQAIRNGTPNKVIAYELNISENTVKVHVRNIMKKLHAKNRTDVAIKCALLASPRARSE